MTATDRAAREAGRRPRVSALPSAGRRSDRRRRRRLDVHLASVLGRARADASALALAVALVAVTALLAAATPRLVAATTDDAVRDAVRSAGADATVVLDAPFARDEGGVRRLHTGTAADVDAAAALLAAALPEPLRDAVGAPVATVSTLRLHLTLPRGERGSSWLTLTAVRREGPPAVTWLEGGPGRATVTASDVAQGATDDLRVEVGLSEAAAALLDADVGDALPVRQDDGTPVPVVVSGVFRPDDPADPVWASAPGLTEPRVRGSGLTTETVVAGLLSDEALPVARLVVPDGRTSRTYAFAPDPDGLTREATAVLPPAIGGLEASPPVLPAVRVSVSTQLDALLLDAGARVAAARAQAAVLLAGVVAAAGLALVLVLRLVVRRRAAVLAHRRARGGTLAGVAAELLVESAAVTAVGAGLGVAAAAVLVPGPVSWSWLVPVVVVALAAGPVLGVLASATATDGRRTPADARERRHALRTRAARRLTLEAALVVAAVGAVVALRSRGVADDDVLTAAAPTLAAAAGGVLLLRAVPPLVGAGLRRGVRSRRLVPVLAAARAHATARDALPLVALAVAAAVATLAAAVGATVAAGQERASWAAVGADVAATTVPDAALADVAADVAARDGVTAAAAVRVEPVVQVRGDGFGGRVRVVLAAPDDVARLAAAAPALGLPVEPLEPSTAVVSPDVAAGPGDDVSLALGEGQQRVRVVGVAPLAAGTVLVASDVPAPGAAADVDTHVDSAGDTAADARAPDTVWAVGPGARAAVAAVPALADADVVTRADVLAATRAAPLTAGLARLVTATLVVLLVLTAVVAVVGAATGAPARGVTLARLRTLGLTGREARAVTLGELLLPVVVGAGGAVAVGVLVAAACAGPLGLRAATGGTAEPALVVPWWSGLPAVVALGTVVVVVLVESSLRRRERLGQVLRVGG